MQCAQVRVALIAQHACEERRRKDQKSPLASWADTTAERLVLHDLGSAAVQQWGVSCGCTWRLRPALMVV